MSRSREEEIRFGAPEDITIREVLRRGVEQVLPQGFQSNIGQSEVVDRSLERQLRERRIKLYLGIDPTAPDLHLGHAVPLRKLRQLQDLGHEVVLLFGTFTGMIGDPTDKTATRVRLTPQQVERNVATYVEQAGKILDLTPEADNPVTIVYNHEWLGRLTFTEVVELMANVTVGQMLERRGFQERVTEGKPVWLHELTYPLMQGYDSVALGVDLEVGGKDQTFNMLVGRDLVGRYLGREKWVMAMKLVEDPGGKKMGKTEGNIVGVKARSEVKFEALMTWPDSAIPMGLELLTGMSMDEIVVLREMLDREQLNPMDIKRAMAFRVIKEIDGEDAAFYAEKEYDRVKKQGQLPRVIDEVMAERGVGVENVLVVSGLASNETNARVLLVKGSIWVDGKQIGKDYKFNGGEEVISVGKRTIRNVRRLVFT